MTSGEKPPTVSSAYDRWSERYDTDINPTRDLDAIVLRDSGPPVDGLDVLELGCGTGKNTVWLAERAKSVIAVDASAGMLSMARRRVSAPNVRFIEQDIRALAPIADASVEVVVIDLVLEHVREVGHVFAEAARVLRLGGALFVCELHPVRQMLGGRAHFVDEIRGETVYVPVVQHTVSEFINSGIAVGLAVERVGEWWDEGPGEPAAGRGSAGLPRLFSVLFRKR